MTAERILDTLRFYDLQDLPLTAYEVYRFLLQDRAGLKTQPSDKNMKAGSVSRTREISFEDVINYLDDLHASGRIDALFGYYSLSGRNGIINTRLRNYIYGIRRERLIRRFIKFLGYIPFVRGVALAGSQAMGQEKESSDIDLLLITEPGRMWTARTLVTIFFHLLRLRRHGKYIANRFCLNHYVAGQKLLEEGRNLYSASEYVKLRSLVYPESVFGFLLKNQAWLQEFFPNFNVSNIQKKSAKPILQKLFESPFANQFGVWLEEKLSQIEKKRIHTDQYVRVRQDELSFHPNSKQENLLARFFEYQE